MGSSYGSSLLKISPLTKEEFHEISEKNSNDNWSSFLRVMIVILEVGASLFVPEASPLFFASQIGIGLAGAAANTAVSYATNSITSLGLAFDFASPFIPIGGALRFSSKVNKVLTSETLIAREASLLEKVETIPLQVAAKRATKAIAEADSSFLRQVKRGMALKEKYKQMDKVSRKRAVRFVKRYLENKLTKEDKIMIKVMEDAGGKAQQVAKDFEYFIKGGNEARKDYAILHEANSYLNKAFKDFKIKIAAAKDAEKTAYRVAEQQLLDIKDMINKIKDFKFHQKISKSVFIENINKINVNKNLTNEMIDSLYLTPMKSRKIQSITADKMITLVQQKALMDNMSENGRNVMNSLFNQIGYNKNKFKNNELSEMIDIVLNSLSKEDKIVFYENFSKDKIFETINILQKSDGTFYGKWVKKFGSKEFNDKFVQRAQFIDPNDLGRAGPEWAYQKLRNMLIKNSTNKEFAWAKRVEKELMEESADLKSAWVNSGGVLLNSKYIIGLKKLPGGFGNNRVVMVKFNSLNTGSTSGKNIGGKKDIIVSMTDEDYDMLVQQGTAYWFEVGKKKGWFLSRGGKTEGSATFGVLSNELSLFLGFAPIPALRNILSIISNWVENIADMARGYYLKDYIAKFERAIIRTSINRSGRLLTKGVIGGLASRKMKQPLIKKLDAIQEKIAKNKLNEETILQTADRLGLRKELTTLVIRSKNAGDWVGRELQRITTMTLTSFEGKTKDGFFTFKRTDLKSYGRKFATNSLPISVKGNLIRKSTRVIGANGSISKRTGGRQLISSKRNLGQIARSWSAITPSGIPQLRTITRIKR